MQITYWFILAPDYHYIVSIHFQFLLWKISFFFFFCISISNEKRVYLPKRKLKFLVFKAKSKRRKTNIFLDCKNAILWSLWFSQGIKPYLERYCEGIKELIQYWCEQSSLENLFFWLKDNKKNKLNTFISSKSSTGL